MTDGLSTLYQDLLSGSYDCVDRIALNAYFRMGHSPGGFRVWVAGADRVGRNPRKCLPDAAGRPFQPSRSRLCQSAQYCGHRLFGGGAQARHCHRISLQDHRRAGLISGLGWSSAGAGLGCQRQTPHRTKDADPVRQPLLVSYPGPRMGSSHHQSQRGILPSRPR